MNNDIDKLPENIADVPGSTTGVGFCQPPASTRFKKGVSGNPKGRPKGSLNVNTVFMKILRERVVINEHGQRKSVTKLEAALKQLVNKAAGGDLRAIAQLRDLAREAEEKQSTKAIQRDSGVDELDREVIFGILQRFQQQNDEGQASQSEEVQDGRNE